MPDGTPLIPEPGHGWSWADTPPPPPGDDSTVSTMMAGLFRELPGEYFADPCPSGGDYDSLLTGGTLRAAARYRPLWGGQDEEGDTKAFPIDIGQDEQDT